MVQEARMEGRFRQIPALSQQARMTIHVLQMPLMDLREYLEQELWENPMLEDLSKGEEGEKEDVDHLESVDTGYPELEHPGSFNSGEDEEKRRYRETLITKEEDLEDHLLWQLGMFTKGKDHEVGEYIIGNLDSNGYLKTDIGEISSECGVEKTKAGEILSLIQTFDPAGVASRDPRECLLIQLRSQGKEDTLSYRIVEECLEELKKKDHKGISKKLNAGPQEVKKACSVISSLEPKPGRSYSTEKAAWSIPDIIVKEDNGDFSVELNEGYIPVLRISKFYLDLLKDKGTDDTTKDYLKKKRERARWIINAILQRQDTIKRISEFVVNFQKDFFSDPAGRIKPLKLDDVAKELEISESTVSRVVAKKYMQTDLGVVPLKSLFSTALKKESGEDISSAEVKARIRELISAEDPGRPLSDQKIASALKNEGINLARRTVAKYREQMKILPVNLRKR